MSKAGRIIELDVLRGIAALGVVLFHFTTKYHHEYGHDDLGFSFNYGYFGVDLFFMISGYVIYMSISRVKTAFKFFWARFSRLFPVYWAGIIITFTAVSIFGLSGRVVSIKSFLFNFTMLQDLFQIPSVDGAYWSLLPELMFYILMGVIIHFKLIKQIQIVNLIWLSLILIHQFIPFPEIIQSLFNINYGTLFISGISFYSLKHKPTNYNKYLNFTVMIAAWLISYFIHHSMISFMVITAFNLIFIVLHFNLLNFIKIKPLIFFGIISYPFYIVNQNIAYILMNKMELNFWVEILISITFTIAIAASVHFFIEKPSLKYLRNKFKNN